jgi:hypothetical protein
MLKISEHPVMAEIYGLFSGRDGKVRYVGRTSGSRAARLKTHLRFQHGRYVSSVREWIHEEWRAGFPVESALLEECRNEASDDIETEWIARFPNLLNDRKRNRWHNPTPPIIQEIKEYQARFIFNVGGFHCVHYWRDLDRYSVFMHDADNWYWLPGDGAPGWSGEIWFSDIAAALKARDRSRSLRQGRKWPRDIEQEAEWPIHALRRGGDD